MKPNQPPDVIYLQVHGEDLQRLSPPDFDPIEEVDSADVTWCADQVFDTDVRYIRDKRYGRKPSGEKPSSPAGRQTKRIL